MTIITGPPERAAHYFCFGGIMEEKITIQPSGQAENHLAVFIGGHKVLTTNARDGENIWNEAIHIVNKTFGKTMWWYDATDSISKMECVERFAAISRLDGLLARCIAAGYYHGKGTAKTPGIIANLLRYHCSQPYYWDEVDENVFELKKLN